MAQETGQEKTEQPTPKRREDARKKGQVPRSRELTTMAVLLTAASAVLFFGDHMLEGILAMMREVWQLERSELLDVSRMSPIFLRAVADALLALFPFFLLLTLIALAAPMLISGWSFSTEALAFKWEKLNPVKGLGRMFSWRSAMELVKALAKFSVVLLVALWLLWHNVDDLLALGAQPVFVSLSHTGELLSWSFLVLSSAMILIAAVDVPFQLWDHNRKLRMTRQEVKDEYKDTEGSPELKRKVREVQQEMAQRRMMEEVPKADVVITNPTHYAVALRYDPDSMGAPVVVAKGRDVVAARIRALAVEHEVPIVSAPPLSRALYHHTDLGHEIPAGLFMAVAQVLAYTYQLRRRPYRRSDEAVTMDDLPIPEDLRHD
ncbi:MAG TPA: flagellar type III secretion system protein FlhB [Gammaproteobacteria bacterium]|nr:flagellar type III secretion system protein FlhB [Gammaproteobacteria bacterium]